MMKKRNVSAILAALMLLTACTGCGSAEDAAFTDVTKRKAGDGIYLNGAEDVAADADAGGEAYDYDVADHGEAEAEVAFDGIAADAAFTAGEAPKAAAAFIDGEPAPDEVYPEEMPPVENAPSPEIGMLTAGEWRDHDNWGFFTNLVNNGTITFPSFGIDPTQRIAVYVKNAAGEALPNARAQLLSADGSAVWNAVTDKNGVAYVFDKNGSGAGIAVTTPDGMTGSAAVEALQGDSQGNSALVSDRSAEIIVEASPVLYQDTQVMFILDTTGSMGDEMFFLQKDFSAIVEETGDGRTSYAVSFYKDEGDEYTTRTASGFTTDAQAIRSQLNAESASGGGDEPEAVAEALSEAFHMDGWADGSVKIAFLIYDAPPHYGKEAVLQDAIAAASEKGIHVIPVVSSNGSRETELFGRAAAVCTNGSYVFLTDHSGIGGSHLEPIIGDYEVEKLHDIIVRIINNYKQ